MVSEEKIFEIVDGWTDAGRTDAGFWPSYKLIVKFVLNDVKATAFSGSKRRDIRKSSLVPLASQSNVASNTA